MAWHGTGTTRWRHGGVEIQASEALSVSSHNLFGISVFEFSASRETAYFYESDDFRWLTSARLRPRFSRIQERFVPSTSISLFETESLQSGAYRGRGAGGEGG